jgi:hypothetical protein
MEYFQLIWIMMNKQTDRKNRKKDNEKENDTGFGRQ